MRRSRRGQMMHLGSRSRELLNEVENMFNQRMYPLDLVARGQRTEMLGGFSAAWDWIMARPTSEVLRQALEKLKQDRSFDVRNADSPYRRIDQLVGGGSITSSPVTHQERKLARSKG